MKLAFHARLPALLLVLLILLQVVLAWSHHLRRGYCPAEVQHDGYFMTVNEVRLLKGWVPLGSTYSRSPGERNTFFRWDRAAQDQLTPATLWRELFHGRLRGLWRNSGNQGYWNELPHPFILPALIYTISGGSLAAAALTPQIYLAILLLSLFGLGRRLAGPWVGLSAAAIASGYPGIFGIAWTHHDSLPLAALTIALAYLLLRCDGFRNTGAALAAGAVAFLASRTGETVTSTLEVAMVAFFPFAVEVGLLVKRGRKDRKEAIRGAIGLGLFLLLALSLFEWPRLMTFFSQVKNAQASGQEYPPLFGFDNSPAVRVLLWYLAYPAQLAFDTVRPVMTLWFMAGAVLAFRRPVGARKLAIGMMVLMPLIVITVVDRKAAWYLPILLPPMALITALGLARLRGARPRALALGLASASGLLVLAYYSIPSVEWRQWLNPGQYISAISKAVTVPSWELTQEGSEKNRLRLAESARHFAEHLHRNQPPEGGIWQVAMLSNGHSSALAFQYLVELREPRVLLVDLLNTHMSPEIYTFYEKERFDYLIYLADHELVPWPEGNDLDMIASRKWRLNHLRLLQRGKWLKIFKKLRTKKWERVDFEAGPAYRRMDPKRLGLPRSQVTRRGGTGRSERTVNELHRGSF